MKTIDFFGSEVRIDEARTIVLCNQYCGDMCQCEGCTNGRMTRTLSTPTKQAEILKAMSLDPLTPYETWVDNPEGDEPPGWGRRVKCWFAFGELVGAETTQEFALDGHNRMRIETLRSKVDARLGNLTRGEFEEPGLIYVFASNAEPWFYGEVEDEFVALGSFCPNCRNRYRMTAVLKPASRIPQWEGMPELSAILREGKHRVRVQICDRCGHLEYDLTPP